MLHRKQRYAKGCRRGARKSSERTTAHETTACIFLVRKLQMNHSRDSIRIRQKRQGDLSAFAIMVANTLSSFNVGRLVSYESLMSFNLL